MRKILLILTVIALIGAYLHYVRGFEFGTFDAKEVTDRFYRDALQVLPEDGAEKEEPIGTRWEIMKPMLTPRSEIGAAAIGKDIYVVGGLDGYGRTLRSVEIYDTETDTWSNAPQMPQALHHPAVTTDGEKLYVAGGLVGITSKPVDTAYVYDPSEHKWSELGRLNDFRGSAVAGFVEGRLVVVGGQDLIGPTGAAEAYDSASARWQPIATMPTPRVHPASVSTPARMYVAGGRTHYPDGNVGALEALTLNEGGGVWKKLEDVPTPRSGFAMASVGGNLFVFGGEGSEGPIPAVEEYRTDSGKWLPFGHMPTPRQGLAAVAVGNRIFVMGGGKRSGYSVSDLNEVLIIEE